MKVLRFASIYKYAAIEASVKAKSHRWAAGIVNQAFQQVMGRSPTQAERQIVMAVSDLESNYGKGWGNDSHNWGAVQETKKNAPQFKHQDSSVKGKYTTGFKEYPSDVAGAADVIKLLFKDSNKQHEPDPNNGFRATGPAINGPGRAELINNATSNGDINAFSKAMWYTSYYEGVAQDFTDRIKGHEREIQSRINSIASALGENPAWSIKSNNYLPVTNDHAILNNISRMSNKAGHPSNVNAPLALPQQRTIEQILPQNQDISGLENMLWFN